MSAPDNLPPKDCDLAATLCARLGNDAFCMATPEGLAAMMDNMDNDAEEVRREAEKFAKYLADTDKETLWWAHYRLLSAVHAARYAADTDKNKDQQGDPPRHRLYRRSLATAVTRDAQLR